MKKRKKKLSYVKRILNKKEYSLGLLILAFPLALLLDLLRFLRKLLLALFGVGIIVGSITAFFVYGKIKPIYDEYNEFAIEKVENSSESTFRPEETTFIYDNQGKVLAKLKGNKDTDYLDYSDIPSTAIDAFVAVEDRTFWENKGIDLKGIARIIYRAVITKGEELHGASTITQQLARNIFLTHEVSLERKGKEMLIALKLTEKYTKRDIMEYYINNICYGNAYYGLEAAARGYFNKTSDELTISEIVYLCALPNRPEYYNPYKYPQRAVERRDKMLGDMYELGYLNSSEYHKALRGIITIEKPKYEFDDYQSTFAIDCATRYLMEYDGFEFKYSFENKEEYNLYKDMYNESYDLAKQKLSTGGYRIYTTLDSNIQTNMQNILDENLAFNDEVNEETGIFAFQGALTVIDNSTGKVVALVGGRSQEELKSNYGLNRAFQSPRQPGSSIKPLIVYGPALHYGYTPNTVVFDISVSEAKKKGVDVQSLIGNPMTLKGALEWSKNGVAWQIFDRLTPKVGMSYIEEMEFSNLTLDDYYNASSLGGFTYGTTTVEMASGFSTLANHGRFRPATCIDLMYDSSGVNIYVDREEKQVYGEKEADTLVDMMQAVIKSGTASSMGWSSVSKLPAAGKTGTTNGSKDGWFCGITPYYSIAVWVGFDTPRTVSGMYGSTYPAQIWKKAMNSLTSELPLVAEFEKSEAYYKPSEVLNALLPEHAYEIYMPGRDDNEEISPGYTVYNYRSDRLTGERVKDIVDKINTIDRNNPDWINEVNVLYGNGGHIVSTIYGISYRNEMQAILDGAYNTAMASVPILLQP